MIAHLLDVCMCRHARPITNTEADKSQTWTLIMCRSPLRSFFFSGVCLATRSCASGTIHIETLPSSLPANHKKLSHQGTCLAFHKKNWLSTGSHFQLLLSKTKFETPGLSRFAVQMWMSRYQMYRHHVFGKYKVGRTIHVCYNDMNRSVRRHTHTHLRNGAHKTRQEHNGSRWQAQKFINQESRRGWILVLCEEVGSPSDRFYPSRTDEPWDWFNWST